jgi:integrase
MTIANLNRQTIAALPGNSEALLWDTTLKGFGFLARRDASGAIRKSFVIQYRFAGQQRKLKLGDANKLNVEQARKKAEKLFAQILLGVDPQAAKDAERIEAAKLTFGQAVEQYLQMKAGELRPSSLKSLTLYLTGPAYFPSLHRKPLDSITRGDVARHLDEINTESGSPSASRARAHLSSFFMWCLRRGHCRENIVLQTEEPKGSEERTRALSADELRAVWNACDDSDYGRIVRLLILTGCRREEIGGLRWSEIDLNAGTITLPAERCKNGRPHVLSLPGMALDIIRAVPQTAGRDHLFGGHGQGFVAWSHSKKQLLAATGEMKEWRLHDLRHTVSTGMHDMGIEPHIVEAVLNHVSGHKAGVAGRYNGAKYERQIQSALAAWAEHIHEIATGESSPQSPGKLIHLRRA